MLDIHVSATRRIQVDIWMHGRAWVLNYAWKPRRGILVEHMFLPNLLQEGWHEGEEEEHDAHDECWEAMVCLYLFIAGMIMECHPTFIMIGSGRIFESRMETSP